MLHDAQRTVGAERGQRLDQHRGLDRHVQRPGDARAFQRLLALVFLAHRHQAGHLGLGDRDFLAAEIGQRDVGDVVVAGTWSCCCSSCQLSIRKCKAPAPFPMRAPLDLR